jgi:hypothetical protein
VFPSIDCWHFGCRLSPGLYSCRGRFGGYACRSRCGTSPCALCSAGPNRCAVPLTVVVLSLSTASCCRPRHLAVLRWTTPASALVHLSAVGFILSAYSDLRYPCLRGATLTPIQYGGAPTLAVDGVPREVSVGVVACQQLSLVRGLAGTALAVQFLHPPFVGFVCRSFFQGVLFVPNTVCGFLQASSSLPSQRSLEPFRSERAWNLPPRSAHPG